MPARITTSTKLLEEFPDAFDFDPNVSELWTSTLDPHYPNQYPRTLIYTFGQQYRDEPHPYIAEVHPDGWIEVFATSETELKCIISRFVRFYYSSVNDKFNFLNTHSDGFYPKGCLRILTIEDLSEPVTL